MLSCCCVWFDTAWRYQRRLLLYGFVFVQVRCPFSTVCVVQHASIYCRCCVLDREQLLATKSCLRVHTRCAEAYVNASLRACLTKPQFKDIANSIILILHREKWFKQHEDMQTVSTCVTPQAKLIDT